MMPRLDPGMPGTRRGVLTPDQIARIRAIVAQAPPLTPEQRERLRPILAGTIAARREAA